MGSSRRTSSSSHRSLMSLAQSLNTFAVDPVGFSFQSANFSQFERYLASVAGGRLYSLTFDGAVYGTNHGSRGAFRNMLLSSFFRSFGM